MRQCKISRFKLGLALFGAGLNFCATPSGAAPCCARNSATPMLIVGDDEIQFGVGTAYASTLAEPDQFGVPVYYGPGISDVSQSLRMDGAFMLSDRFQVGLGFSAINHSVTDAGITDRTVAMGDSRIGAGYEILPSWSYSVWKPQVFLYAGLTLPTGRSKYEFQKASLSDVNGNGFYSLSIGSLVVRHWGNWDVFLIPEIHYSAPRTFGSPVGDIQAYPGFGGSLGIGGGWSPGGGDLRVGLRVTPRLDQATVTVTSFSEPQSEGVLSVCDAGLDASYMIGSTNTLMLSYTDQSLIGIASNLVLTRSLSLNFQHRWER